MTDKKPLSYGNLPDEEESEWLSKVKALDFTSQIKLAIALGLMNSGHLPFDQRKDLIRTSLNIYCRVYACDLIKRVLSEETYSDRPKGLSLDECRVAAFALWADRTVDELQTEMGQLINLQELARDLKPKEDPSDA